MNRYTDTVVLGAVNVLGKPLFVVTAVLAGAVLAIGVAFIGTVGRLFN
jgi:hypothetical protein